MNEKNFVHTRYNKPFIAQRADPFVTRTEEGDYLFTASVPEYDRIVLRKSHTLDGLAQAPEITVWKKHEKGPMSFNVWAPEIHRMQDGKWYIYFAASRENDIWALRPYALRCTGSDPVRDSWEECGPIRAADTDEFSFRAFSLDMTVFENAGRWYAVWAEKVGVGKMISNLYIAEMKTPTMMQTAQVLLTTPDYDWERGDFWVDEGPGVIRNRDGRIFLTFSASSTGAEYCVGMMTADPADDLLDPLSWKKGRYPVLRTDWEKGILGPGHNSFTKLPDGTDVMIYHARNYDEIEGDPLYDPNRHTYRLKVRWDKDGMPVFPIENNF